MPSLFCKRVKRSVIAVNETPVLELQGVTCYVGSQSRCYLPTDTSEHTPPVRHAGIRLTYTPEGWKAELT